MNKPTVLYQILMWGLIIGFFFVFLILPEKKRQKNLKKMMDSLKVGDKVMTRGGVIGKIINVKEDSIIIESGPENTRIEMSKVAVGTVLESKENYTEVK